MKTIITIFISVICILLCCFPAGAQSFGKNKVVYNALDWYFTETEHFNIHWYEGMELYVPYLKDTCEKAYEDLSSAYNHQLEEKIPIIFYLNSDDFQQTNIYSGFVPEGVRGFAEPFNFRVVIPLDEPLDTLKQVIIHEINHIFQFSMYYRSIAMIVSRMPLWFDEGLSVHMAKQWDSQRKMYLRDALYRNIIPKIKDFGQSFFEAYVYGASIVGFIEKEYGIDGLRSLIFEASKQKTKNFPSFLEESLDIDIDELDRLWRKHLKDEEFPCLFERDDPYDYSRRFGERKPGVSSFSPEPSPSGSLLAYLTNASMFLGIRIMNIQEDEDIFNLTRGKDYNDYLWLSTEGSAISWSPDGEKIAFSAKWEGKYRLYILDVLTRDIIKRFDLDIHNVKTPCFYPDSRRLAFAGNEGGLTNIYELDIETGIYKNLTDSKYFDKDPALSDDGNYLYFSSYREGYFRLVELNLVTMEENLLINWEGNCIQPYYIKGKNSLLFSSDRKDDISDLYIYQIEDKTASRITNITTGCFTPKVIYDLDKEPLKIVFSGYEGQRNNLFMFEYSDIEYHETVELGQSDTHEYSLYLGPEGFSDDDRNKLRTKYYVDTIDVAAAYRSDGLIVGQTILAFSDILGDNNLIGIYQQFGNYANAIVYYTNVKNRLNYGSVAYYNNYINYVPGSDGSRYMIDKFWGFEGFISYPFSLFSRVELSLGYENAKQPIYRYLGLGDPESQILYTKATLVTDKTLYNIFGPFKGYRASLSFSYAPPIGDEFDSNFTAVLDSRLYLPFSRRNLFAFRLAGGYSSGDKPRLFYIGGADTFLGNNTLRGYDISEFYGTKFGLINIEWRLPLIDLIAFAFGLHFPYIQGTLFWDMGVAWDDTSELDLFHRPNGSLEFKDIKSSLGYAINVPVQGVLFTWSYIRKFNLRKTTSDTILQFTIGTRF